MIDDQGFDFFCDHFHVSQCCSEEFFAYSESLQISGWSSQYDQTGFLIKYDFDGLFRDWPLNVRREDDFFILLLDHARQDPSKARVIFTVGLWGREAESCFPKLEG